MNKKLKTLQATWRSPSNIALIKYWGKHTGQVPCNPSLSLTLSRSFTETKIVAIPFANLNEKQQENFHDGSQFAFEYVGDDDVSLKGFNHKLENFLANTQCFFSFLKHYYLEISSRNSFPHSAGIASSASSMSSLALCLYSLEEEFLEQEMDKNDFYKKASFIARLGSGSAGRSVYGSAALWGEVPGMVNSSDFYAIPLPEKIHPNLVDLQDTILIVDHSSKKVSSSEGHRRMQNNPYAKRRFALAKERVRPLLNAMSTGDFMAMGPLIEQEAMELHAMFLLSAPPQQIMQDKTWNIIEKVKAFREETKVPLFFTLDAGPNVHLLYLKENLIMVKGFIEKELAPLCQEEKVIFDCMGNGPTKL